MGVLDWLLLVLMLLWTLIYYIKPNRIIDLLLFASAVGIWFLEISLESLNENVLISVMFIALTVINICVGAVRNKKESAVLTGELIVYIVYAAVAMVFVIIGTLIVPYALSALFPLH